MCRILLLVAMAALISSDSSWADRLEATLASGYNESSFTAGLNRSTNASAELTLDRQYYAASIDQHGLSSVGIGRIIFSRDHERHMLFYPMATVFVHPETRPGIELSLHYQWSLRKAPSSVPSWILTVFDTETGIIALPGGPTKVRVSHRFTTTTSRRATRIQGLEWIWEFRPDYPADRLPTPGSSQSVNPEANRADGRRSMRHEVWAFFSREAGPVMVGFRVGATKRTVWRTKEFPLQPGKAASNTPPLVIRERGTEVVGLLRFEIRTRRWW